MKIELSEEERKFLIYLCETSKSAVLKVIEETFHDCLKPTLCFTDNIINKLSEKDES